MTQMTMNINDQLAQIKRGADELLIETELIEKLKKGMPLRVKAGFDPQRHAFFEFFNQFSFD